MNSISRVRHCTSRDGTRLAYRIDGGGFPPVVEVAHWFGDLDALADGPLAGHWLDALRRRDALVRYDQRGFGASERTPGRVSLDAWVEDLEAVVEASGHAGVVLFAASQAVPVAIRYAARHPSRVLALLAWGGFARGPGRRDGAPANLAAREAALGRARANWHDPATFRALFSSRFAAGADAPTLDAIDGSMRTLCDGEVAARTLEAYFDIDVEADARGVRCPAWVVRADGDRVVPPLEAARLAVAMPAARVVSVAGSRHLPLAGDEAWPEVRRLLCEALDECAARLAATAPRLSARQREVLRWVAHGLSDREVGERLGLSHRTVGEHVSGAMRVLRARSRDEAVRLAAARGLLG